MSAHTQNQITLAFRFPATAKIIGAVEVPYFLWQAGMNLAHVRKESIDIYAGDPTNRFYVWRIAPEARQ